MKKDFGLLVFILSIALLGCNDHNGLIDYDLKKMNAVIKIPSSFKHADDKIINRVKDSKFKNYLLGFYFKNNENDLLIDTLNSHRYILISEIKPYVPIDSGSFYLAIDQQRSLSSSHLHINDSTYYIGSKMGGIAGYKFIESKHIRTSNNKELIDYSYMISSDNKTMGIAFISQDNQDVRQFINSIQKKRP